METGIEHAAKALEQFKASLVYTWHEPGPVCAELGQHVHRVDYIVYYPPSVIVHRP